MFGSFHFYLMGIEILYIAIGGALGAVFRGVGCIIADKFWKNKFPLAVFVINVIGCFLIGIFTEITIRKHYPIELEHALVTGFCGGFSTWSTMASQTFKLATNGSPLIAAISILSNHIVGFFFCWLGQLIGEAI